jgi:hypothetical protein
VKGECTAAGHFGQKPDTPVHYTKNPRLSMPLPGAQPGIHVIHRPRIVKDVDETEIRTRAMIAVYALYLYVLLGFLVGLAFVILGVTRVLPEPTTVTVGARILLLPFSLAAWPYILLRWIRARGGR